MEITPVRATDLADDQLQAWAEIQRGNAAVDNPFFAPQFTQAVAAERDDVEVAVLQEGGSDVGFFPFHRKRRDIGTPVGEILSDMHGVTVRQDLDWCIEDILRACGLAAWNFDHLISSQKAFHAYHYLLDDSPYIALNDGFEEYLTRRRGMSSTCVVQAQRKLRKLDREVGPVRFELHTGDSSVFDRLVEWKRAQLGRPSMFELDWVVPVLRRIAYTDNGPRFRGLLSALYAGDDLVAVHLGIHAGPVVASWIPTYSQKFARFSPGLLIHLELARSVSAQGVRRIELGRGTNQLKRGLASGARPVAIGRVDACPSARVVRKRWARVKAGIRESPRYRFLYEIYRMCRRRMSTSA